jgi:transcriptional regulator with XRE-family HTH domain
MERSKPNDSAIDFRLSQRLKALRTERAWSLEDLAKRSSVSRATLSRLENAEVSPTTNVLGKLCAAYGLTLSRLMRMVEDDFVPLVSREDQSVWTDTTVGFRRRIVSPPARTLAGEALECALVPGALIEYEMPPRPGLEHHLLLQDGLLTITIGERTYDLKPGDCLRYQLFGPSTFATPADSGARYILFMV